MSVPVPRPELRRAGGKNRVVYSSYLEAEASRAADSDSVIVSGSGVHYHINESRTSCFTWREFVDRPYLDRYNNTQAPVVYAAGKVTTLPSLGVTELIPVLGSQPAGDVSHKPGGRLPLLSARPAVTPAITTLRSLGLRS